ncbi:hypothetical protein Cni_G15084 [Canna indica]|uniref:Uncharacterized protein n=1 Tax=Canna indica TaxID=4628 RepID=A0AAQ3KDF0_9LILI|nr:hypothetical protein Cni_G15084 [Canna indica]
MVAANGTLMVDTSATGYFIRRMQSTHGGKRRAGSDATSDVEELDEHDDDSPQLIQNARLKYPVAKVSTISVPMAATIAQKPANGKSSHGFESRHGDVRFSKASDSMWMNPVARMTPAANTLTMENTSFSGRRNGIYLSSTGIKHDADTAADKDGDYVSDLERKGLLRVTVLLVGGAVAVPAREEAIKTRTKKNSRHALFISLTEFDLPLLVVGLIFYRRGGELAFVAHEV